MAKRKSNLVDAFLFKQAKDSVDAVTSSEGKTKDKSVDITMDKTADYPRIVRGQSADISVDIDTVISPDLSTDKTKDRTIDKASDTTQDKTKDITMDKTVGISFEMPRLTKQETKVYNLLKRWGNGYTNAITVASKTHISREYVIKIFRRLKNKGVIGYKRQNGTIKGFQYWLTDRADVSLYDGNRNLFISEDKISVDKSAILSTEISADKILKKSSLIEEEELINLLLNQNSFSAMFPKLCNIGFSSKQIKDVISAWKTQNLKLHALPESFSRVEYAVETKTIKMDNPLNYVYSALMRGEFAKPKGYKTPAEKQADAELAEAKTLETKLKEAADIRFKNMMMSPQEKLYQQCLAGLNQFERRKSKGPSFEAGMRRVFNEIERGAQIECSE